MKKLFEDFNAVSLEEFEAQLIKDLKGKPLESLTTQPENDLTVKAYSHPSEKIPFNNLAGLKKSNAWVIRQEFDKDSTNQEILDGLNQGLNGIGITSSVEQFNSLTKEVLFDHIHADLTINSTNISEESSLVDSIITRFDPIAAHCVKGEKIEGLDAFQTYFSNFKKHKNIWVTGVAYGDAGASSVQELAATLGHYNEYLNVLYKENKIDDLLAKSTIELSITENYFVNIAKYRAIRILLKTLASGYDYAGDISPTIAATSSTRSLAQNDAHNNLLRATTQAMSAVLGGCDILTLRKVQLNDEKYDAIHQRMLKNISLILAEESYFDKVGDAGAGAYYIEKLTQELVTKSWTKFQETEAKGGFIVALNENTIQDEIITHKNNLIAALNSKKRTLLGVNKYQNSMEEFKSTAANHSESTTELSPLSPLNLESHFQPVEA